MRSRDRLLTHAHVVSRLRRLAPVLILALSSVCYSQTDVAICQHLTQATPKGSSPDLLLDALVAGPTGALWVQARGHLGPDEIALLTAAPDTIRRWSGLESRLGSLGVVVVFHETRHQARAALTRCREGRATYWFDGQVMETDLRFGDSLHYGIAEAVVPAHLRRVRSGSRYARYIEGNGRAARSDFTVLLDEFSAYVSDAGLELSLLEAGWWPQADGIRIDNYDGGIAASGEFMLYTLAYLQALREQAPSLYASMVQQPRTVQFVRRIWARAVSTLTRYHALTLKQTAPAVMAWPEIRWACSTAVSDVRQILELSADDELCRLALRP